jgi:hypothetical protein
VSATAQTLRCGLIGVLVLHGTLVLAVAIGSVVVLVMKGPADVADAAPPPGRTPPV